MGEIVTTQLVQVQDKSNTIWHRNYRKLNSLCGENSRFCRTVVAKRFPEVLNASRQTLGRQHKIYQRDFRDIYIRFAVIKQKV